MPKLLHLPHMQFFKALTVIVLLGLMFFINEGAFVHFKVRQYQVKKEIKHRIKAGVPENELDLVKIPQEWEKQGNKDFRWVEGHEFRYKGEMYDVVRQESHGDETWYYCVKDEKENELFAELDKTVAREMENDETKGDAVGSSFHFVYLFPQSFNTYFFLTGNEGVSVYAFTLITWDNSPPTQPPCDIV